MICTLLFLPSCRRKDKCYTAEVKATVFNSSTNSYEPNTKLIISCNNNSMVKLGYTDANGQCDLGTFNYCSENQYKLYVADKCVSGNHADMYIERNKSNYAFNIYTTSYIVVNCQNQPDTATSDSVLVDFNHKFVYEPGLNPWSWEGWSYTWWTSHFYYSSNLGRNKTEGYAFSGWYYIHIYKYKSGVYTTTFDSVFVPVTAACQSQAPFVYTYLF